MSDWKPEENNFSSYDAQTFHVCDSSIRARDVDEEELQILLDCAAAMNGLPLAPQQVREYAVAMLILEKHALRQTMFDNGDGTHRYMTLTSENVLYAARENNFPEAELIKEK